FFSPSGLTFYGGLIVATLVIYYYTRKFKIDFRHLADAAAPAIMLAYGIGRLGCQLSGDGDWGIYNTAYASQPNAAIVSVAPADTGKYHYMLMHYNSETAKHEQADHIYYPAAAGLPQWLVAMNYPHNVAYEGMQIEGDTGEFNRVLPICVFPTPIYEFFAAMLLFGVMWGLRKRLNKPLAMIALYMIFAGIERFLVELIRVNTKIDLGFIKPTQAELISVFLVLGGTLILLLPQKKENAPEVLQ
ncbi:MAG: diacylglyceryl transferase, partial [Chitinophagia bacterium]|nr:diacylglyceryl transferase [Chitinophagia bacterium]